MEKIKITSTSIEMEQKDNAKKHVIFFKKKYKSITQFITEAVKEKIERDLNDSNRTE